MKFYDISRELFGSAVYPGDPAPECERLMQVRNGDGCKIEMVTVENGKLRGRREVVVDVRM